MPGTLCTAELFAAVAPLLAQHAALHTRVLSEGSSTHACAAALLADAPPRFALAGFSQGAIVAFEIMRQAPERVTKLALLAANPHSPTEAQQQAWRAMRREVTARGIGPIVDKYFAALYPSAQTAAMHKTLLDMAEAVGVEGFLRQLSMLETRIDSQPSLRSVACPTLIIAGQDDPIVSVTVHEALAAAIPGATLHVLENCGHYSPLEKPEKVGSLLAGWLA